MIRPAVLTYAVLALAAASLTARATISSAATSAATPVADGAVGVLITPSGVAWTATMQTIQRSTNGGRTWHQVLPVGTGCSCYDRTYFIGPRDAWVVRQKGDTAARVLFTNNGGTSWMTGGALPVGKTLQHTEPYPQVDFADAEHGWVLDVGAPGQQLTAVLLSTSDSGQTWQRVSAKLPEAGRPVVEFTDQCGTFGSFGLTFINAQVGWLTGDACGGKTALVWQTSDGGTHWQQVTIPAPAGGWPKDSAVDTAAPVFTSPAAGLLPVTTGPGQLLIYRTGNGGQTWTLASSVTTGSAQRPAGLTALTSNRWVLPDVNGLLVTGDAGRQWRQVGSGVDIEDLVPISLRSDGTGLAEGGGQGTPATFPFVAYRTVDAGRTWAPTGNLGTASGQKRAEQPIGISRHSASTGIRFGLGIDYTTDGGRHWTAAARTVGPVQSASFAPDGHGIALGPLTALATADGGRRWTPAAEPALGPLQSVQMVTGSVGFGIDCPGPDAGQSALERTTNAGKSWQSVRLPGQTDPGAPVGADHIGICGSQRGTGECFTTPQAGYYLSRPGGFSTPIRLYRTANGGRTWRVVRTPLPRSSAGLDGCGGGVLWLIASADSDTNEENGAVFRSADGGRSWHKVLAPNGSSKMAMVPLATLNALDVLGPRVAWVVSSCQGCGTVAVLVTTDAGATWTRPGGSSALVPGVAQVLGSSFSSASDGWLLGERGNKRSAEVLLATTNGGVSWHRVSG